MILDPRSRARFKRHRAAVAALYLFAALALLILAAPIFAALLGLDPDAPNPDHIYGGPGFPHLLGTDDSGRDVFLRLLYGGRISLLVAVIATAASIVIGGSIGLASGYFGGTLDAILMRITETFMAIPRLPFMMLLAALDLGKLLGDSEMTRGSAASVIKLILVISFFGWTGAARLARASALQIRELDYVAAARALGASHARILATHILPNAAAPLIVAATLETGEIIVYESVLSFLGLGVAPPVPSWGAMLANGFSYLHDAPQLLLLPGLMTFLVVALLGLAGDGLRDALDPR